MSVSSKEKYTDEKDVKQKERRRFLKKAMYNAPTIIVLGGLLKPAKANDFGGTPSDVGYTNDSWSTNP